MLGTLLPRVYLLFALLSVLSSTQALSIRKPSTESCDTNADCLKRGLPVRKPRHLYDGVNRRAQLAVPSGVPVVPFQPIPYPGRIQTYTTPAAGYYLVQARGASGGNNTGVNGYGAAAGGVGAVMQAEMYISQGVTLSVVVGLRGGSDPNFAGSGGGGGSFVWVAGATRDTSTALIVAGGGGGTASSIKSNLATKGEYDGRPASLSDIGFTGKTHTPNTVGGSGGVSGLGGGAGTGTNGGGGGAGFFAAGGNSAKAKGGQSSTFAQGAGEYSGNDQHGDGGFGGGGGGGGAGGGGGGGYSGGGGGGGSAECCGPTPGQGGPGGGGGSYINPGPLAGRPVLNTFKALNDNGDDGFVAISYLRA